MHMKVSPIIWKLDLSCKTLNISFKNSLRLRLALILEWCLLIWVVLHALLQVSLRGREGSEVMSGHDFFVEFRSVVYVDIMFTKEFGHLYWVSNCPPLMLRMHIAAIYYHSIWRYI